MSCLAVQRVREEQKKADEWKKLEHVVFVSSPMSRKLVKVMMLLHPAWCSFKSCSCPCNLGLLKWEGGKFFLHRPFFVLCIQCFFP